VEAGKSFEFERHPGYARLTLSPNLNAFQWADIERSAIEILAAVEEVKGSNFIVDLSSLDYLGSAQLALLVRVWKAIKASNGQMVVQVTTPVVREVMNTAGLGSLWQFAESRAEAFQLLELQPDGRPRMPMTWPVIGLIALTGGVAGLCASILKTDGLDAKISLVVQLTCSAVALAAGLWTVIRGTGARRGLGVGMVVASALLAVVEVLQSPR
jgi:anti-anti-sigma factor